MSDVFTPGVGVHRHEYELKKVGCRQDKDGRWLVTVSLHQEDWQSDLVQAGPGVVFKGPLSVEGYEAESPEG